ncbi:uncharacterized protein LOC132636514 isoform X2 [Lycium barbarum]|uniref:uncharacterized protein LOC132636514 isoform X2 n=1 Tax=Lycium barbarum TaxID=112863 RepID=UPI00293EBA24|nr:uncharacterized protein LOC132636514 isoform X2 [Lycium barbarum]
MVLSLTILPSLTKLPSFISTSSFSILHSHSLNSTLILNSTLSFYQFNSFSYLSPSLCLSLHYSLCNLTGILILETLSSSFPVVAQIFFAFSFLWLIKALLLVIMATLEAQRLLEHVIIDYMCKRGFHQTGEVFLCEIFANQNPDAINSLDEAFLQAWWGNFYEAYSSRFPDFPVLAAECFDKVAETVENVVANNGPANQFYSSNHTGVNISNVMPVMPSPQLMVSSPLMESSSPDPMDAMISDLMSRDIPSDLQSEMNEIYQMPTVPPEWNARDDRPDINLGGPAQMELNNHAAANALPASPELSDAGIYFEEIRHLHTKSKLLYCHFNQIMCWPWKMIWKVKVPYKVSCFTWLLARGKALTLDNFCKRGHHLCSSCSSCFLCGEEPETINHLFLHRKLTEQLWRMFLNYRGILWTMPSKIVDVLACWNREGNAIQEMRWKVIPGCIWWTIWEERNQRCFEDKANHFQKIKMKCLGLFYFWCKGIGLEDNESISDVLESL